MRRVRHREDRSRQPLQRGRAPGPRGGRRVARVRHEGEARRAPGVGTRRRPQRHRRTAGEDAAQRARDGPDQEGRLRDREGALREPSAPLRDGAPLPAGQPEVQGAVPRRRLAVRTLPHGQERPVVPACGRDRRAARACHARLRPHRPGRAPPASEMPHVLRRTQQYRVAGEPARLEHRAVPHLGRHPRVRLPRLASRRERRAARRHGTLRRRHALLLPQRAR